MAAQLGERIRELRIKQNMLLRQLASKLDMDTSVISKIERGDRQLKKDQIPRIAQIVQGLPGMFFEGEFRFTKKMVTSMQPRNFFIEWK
jgi:transcriptional regulator with XRE-family HTH domain